MLYPITRLRVKVIPKPCNNTRVRVSYETDGSVCTGVSGQRFRSWLREEEEEEVVSDDVWRITEHVDALVIRLCVIMSDKTKQAHLVVEWVLL